MYKKIKLTFKVTGALDDITVWVANDLVEVVNGKGEYEEEYSGGELEIWFELSGNVGTDYKIVYNCAVDDEPRVDTGKTSPIEDSIETNGYKLEIVKIEV